MNLVGYVRKYPDKFVGEWGQFYTYVVAANGVFVEAKNPLLAARVPVAECPIRGLAPTQPMVKLAHGSIPQHLWELALNAFMAQPDKELYVAITGDGGYHFYVPEQEVTDNSTRYLTVDGVVLDLHSHAHMPAFFSPHVDNVDEAGLRLYGVVGRLDAAPVVKLRVGVFGYFMGLSWKEVFDGTLAGASEQEEVKEECDVQSRPKEHGRQLEYLSDWLRRNWWFRG